LKEFRLTFGFKFYISRSMEISIAVSALSALAQESRLEIFRFLVQAGKNGVPAGKVGERLDMPLSTLSFHLNQLKQAGLILCRREGRTLFYSTNYESMNDLMAYLTENCCQGQAEDCDSPAACAPAGKTK
jgi:ArsR family transcriptional regulator, arsenate/arsenite/antimonite-responsive transcriptional repressor